MEWTRTHYCGDLRIDNVDQEVVLMGWCQLVSAKLCSKWKSVKPHMF